MQVYFFTDIFWWLPWYFVGIYVPIVNVGTSESVLLIFFTEVHRLQPWDTGGTYALMGILSNFLFYF